MPSSRVNIVSPVSGGSTPLDVVINIDYEYNEATAGYLLVKCFHPLPGPEIKMVQSVAANSSGSGSITIPHTTGFTGVEIEARLTDTNAWSSYYVNNSVDEITFVSNPPVVIHRQIGPGPREKFGWSFVITPDAYGKKAFAKKTAASMPKPEHEYDPNADKDISGSVANAYKNGTLQAVVYGRTKFSLSIAQVLKTFSPDPSTGEWTLTIPKAVLKGGCVPRRLVVTLFDNAGEYVGTASTALKKK